MPDPWDDPAQLAAAMQRPDMRARLALAAQGASAQPPSISAMIEHQRRWGMPNAPPSSSPGAAIMQSPQSPSGAWESSIGPRQDYGHEPELRAYQPTWRDQMANALLPDQPSYHAGEISRNVL